MLALALLLAANAAAPAPSAAPADTASPSVAITIDDGPKTQATPLLSPVQRNDALLRALTVRGVRAAAFVTTANGAGEPAGLALLRAWGAAGMLIGNHTVTHPDFNREQVTLAAFEQELLGCDAVIRAVPGYRKWFRFPFLREGRGEKIEAFRAFLRAQGYRNAYVTLDTSDWQFAARLTKRLEREPTADLAPYRAAYLAHVKQRAEAYQQLSRLLLGRDIPQTLLIHHSLLNALFLGDVIDQFRRMGWTVIDPELAYQDPVFQQAPEESVSGQSLLLSLARSRGIDLKPYERLMDDAEWEMKEMDRDGL